MIKYNSRIMKNPTDELEHHGDELEKWEKSYF